MHIGHPDLRGHLRAVPGRLLPVNPGRLEVRQGDVEVEGVISVLRENGGQIMLMLNPELTPIFGSFIPLTVTTVNGEHWSSL